MTLGFEAPRVAHLCKWLVLLSLGLWPTVAYAQGASTENPEELDAHTLTAARTLAAQGAEAFERQDYEEALDLFQRAGSLIQAPTIALMEARTLVALGRWVEAANKYSIAQLMNDPQQHNEAYAEAITAAGQELALLKPRIPLVRIQLVGDLAEGEVQVWLDGRLLPDALVGVDNPVDPGRHRVEIRSRRGSPRAREFEIVEGNHETLRFGDTVPARAPAPEPAAPPPPAPPKPNVIEEPPQRTTQSDTLPWVVLGAGAAATVVGIGTGVAALSKKSDLDHAGCDEGCPPKYKGEIGAYRRYRTFSYLGFGLGLVGLGWGGYLIVSEQPKKAEVALSLTPNGASLSGTF